MTKSSIQDKRYQISPVSRGYVQIYTGGGKGKTTAAMGQCLRAAGHGLQVGVVQFIKDGSSGELKALQRLENVRLFSFIPDVTFTFAMTEEEKSAAHRFYTELLHTVDAASGELDVLLLDEVLDAVGSGLLGEDKLLAFLKDRPKGLEVLLTGRNPSPELIDLADYISEVKLVRHPYQKGISAREGIEW